MTSILFIFDKVEWHLPLVHKMHSEIWRVNIFAQVPIRINIF